MLRTLHEGEPDTLIRHEVGLCASERRVDMAVVNGEFIGYEIKSDEDTLVRLSGQAEAYSRVLDRAVLVTTRRHIDAALRELPEWWGVIVATEDGGNVHLCFVRSPSRND